MFHETPIYLDYSATTPVDPRVAEKMCACLTPDGVFGNPGVTLAPVWLGAAEQLVDEARANVAALVGADPKEIVWTSGATESDNLAIKGQHTSIRSRAGTSSPEDRAQAVLDTCRQLEREGFEVTYLDVQPNGLLDLAVFEAAIRPDTILASVMHVNNEIGVIQDIAAIGLSAGSARSCSVDAAQSRARWLSICRCCRWT